MTTPAPAEELAFTLDAQCAGMRLDAALHTAQPRFSRSYLTKLLKEGAILVNGLSPKPSHKVKGGEHVEIEVPPPEVLDALPEAIPLEVLYEDSDIIVVNKPFGMAAHPSPGHASGTLVNALLAHCKDLSTINGALRPGIVHRLDMDTTGAIVAAKNDAAHQGLQDQFMARSVKKQYLALCHGNPVKDTFSCDGRIGRHPTRRTEMTVLRGASEGREAFTEFQVLQRLLMTNPDEPNARFVPPIALLLCLPKTGRTHQIRVHLAKTGHTILADGLYGREAAVEVLGLKRHALHAWKLAFKHPRTGESLQFVAPLADDLKEALRRLGGTLPA